jgi:hypothetical protein
MVILFNNLNEVMNELERDGICLLRRANAAAERFGTLSVD